MKLAQDYSRYHPGLVVGAVGTTVLPTGRWAWKTDKLITVHFSNGLGFDIPLFDVEVTDPVWVAAREARRNALLAAIDNGTASATLDQTPRGGFKKLTISFTDELGGKHKDFWIRMHDCEDILKRLEGKPGFEKRKEITSRRGSFYG